MCQLLYMYYLLSSSKQLLRKGHYAPMLPIRSLSNLFKATQQVNSGAMGPLHTHGPAEGMWVQGKVRQQGQDSSRINWEWEC